MQNNFSCEFFDAGAVSPFSGLKRAFDVKLGTFFNVVFNDSNQARREDHHAMPFGLIYPLSVFPGIRLGGRDVNVCYFHTARKRAHFRISAYHVPQDLHYRRLPHQIGDGGIPAELMELPDPEDFQTPEEYRRALLEGMRGDVPDEFEALKKRYFEELVRQ